MADSLQSLLEFFGMGVAPQNFAEFIPYFFKGMLGVGFFVFVLSMLRYWGNIGNKF